MGAICFYHNADLDGGWVLDPFCGSGTVLKVAKQLGINFIGIELNPEYVAMAEKRIGNEKQQLKLII